MAASLCGTVAEFALAVTCAGLGHGLSVAFVLVALTDAFGVPSLHRCIGSISFLTGVAILAAPEIAGAPPFMY